MFSPENFCRHSHSTILQQNQCFWGFDTKNWPYYIRLDESVQENLEDNLNGISAQSILENFIGEYCTL